MLIALKLNYTQHETVGIFMCDFVIEQSALIFSTEILELILGFI